MSEIPPATIIGLKDVDYERQFLQAWNSRQAEEVAPLNGDYEATLKRWRRLGVAMEAIEDAIDIAMHKENIDLSSKYRYMCGIVWNSIEASGVARKADGSYPAIYTQEQVDVMLNEEYGMGLDAGEFMCQMNHSEKKESA